MNKKGAWKRALGCLILGHDMLGSSNTKTCKRCGFTVYKQEIVDPQGFPFLHDVRLKDPETHEAIEEAMANQFARETDEDPDYFKVHFRNAVIQGVAWKDAKKQILAAVTQSVERQIEKSYAEWEKLRGKFKA